MRTMFALLMLVAFSTGSMAATMQIKDLLVCETFAQAKRFVELGADKTAIEATNKEFGTDKCVAVKVAFVARGPVGKVQHGVETFVIIEVLIVGMNDGRQIQQLLSPVLWYALAQPGQET